MGLDILLVQIVKEEILDTDWLEAKESLELFPLFKDFIRPKLFKYEDEEYYLDLYFYKEISYQRKGVVRAFYKHFVNDRCLVDKRDVEKVYDFIEPVYKKSFKSEFIDKFVDGETVLLISW